MSASTMLTECEAAISRVMNAKAYTAADMNVQREELKSLRDFRSELNGNQQGDKYRNPDKWHDGY